MYLKKVELHGFKSFANKIEMSFEKGVTAVVGPNGSGKSNISDAIRWVLGEQSVKSLRGSKMEDVIFSGTSNRKALGMAEVSLTLDNSSQMLPIDYEEVTITRRMYRSGESEYYLNKSNCRLKDIRELLMDTGIGKDGYSIIGQGKIDEILSSKSEDRRQLFEEAVGIVKYKHRKQEATKKINATKDNLLRVTDIIHELQSQLGPLEKQSKKAKRYTSLKENLLKLEVNLFIKEIDKIDLELKHIHQQMDMLKKSLALQNNEKESYFTKLEEIQKQLDLWENEIEHCQKDFYATQGDIGKKEGEVNLNQEKLAHFIENIERLEKEVEDIYRDNIKVTKQLEEKLTQLKNVDTSLKELEENLKKETMEYEKINESSTIKLQDIEESKSSIINTLNDISDKKSDGNSLKTLVNTMDHRIGQIHKDRINYEKKEEETQKKICDLQQSLETVLKNLEKTEKEITIITIEKDRIENQQQDIENQLEIIKNQTNHNQSKRNIIEEMEREHDGYNRSVKNTLIACKKDKYLGEGIYGVVANLMKVPKGYETAIETALGAAIQNIVTRNEEDAKKLIAYLKKHNLGRITLLPLTSMQKKSMNQEELEIVKEIDNAKIAIDLVEFHNQFLKVFSNLLGRVVVVPNIDIGVKAAKKLHYKLKIVTVDGDIINIGGSLTGGSSTFKGNSILGRKRELEELNQSIVILEEQGKRLKEKRNILLEQLNNKQHKLEILHKQQQENKIIEATLKSKLQQAKEEKYETTDFIHRMKRELQELEEAKKTTLEKYKLIERAIQDMEETISQTKQMVEGYEENIVKEKQQLEKLNEGITKGKIKTATIREQKKSLLQEIENLQTILKFNETQLEEKNKRIAEINKDHKILHQVIEENKIQLQNLMGILRELEKKLEELKKKRQDLLQVDKQKKESLQQIEEIIKDLNESTYKLDMKCTRLEMQQQSFYNKLWEEYELTYIQAKNIREDITDNINIGREIKTLKDEIKGLGHINMESIQEYENVKERYEFLTNQKDDLEKARQTLAKVIKDMEETMKKQFLEEFIKIRKNFNDVFIKLFGGGKAQLVLEDEKDLLNCGIEIIAQPPGKKLQSLSLLSGGERALTAISLLFGILLVKPSPFCILDEIEAALDDANVNRFAGFLQELSPDTQFVVVTHRRGTMESADALYGVTMEEEGISKIVSVKFTDEMNNEIAS
ncbi:chromosome segregation protein SMC [Natronincola ferrireducens]|uniref:Chromosome partition protein Smc n=1 Tax=Natronincola ferrireducens TaxID=393762 RepID=A0A1G9BY03_9FIRM|nr:chromosome segregation protein SMC [Natronincola ferrireducens]SDK44253.1 condensin subunit Smc [Natronincola ferrireducens]